jgi:hypothetical protein
VKDIRWSEVVVGGDPNQPARLIIGIDLLNPHASPDAASPDEETAVGRVLRFAE